VWAENLWKFQKELGLAFLKRAGLYDEKEKNQTKLYGHGVVNG